MMTTKDNKQDKQLKPDASNAISVVCKSGSFRRGGISFGKAATIIKSTNENKQLIELIKKEPMLTVTDI